MAGGAGRRVEQRPRKRRERGGGAIVWTINEGPQDPYGADGYANPLLDATAAAFGP